MKSDTVQHYFWPVSDRYPKVDFSSGLVSSAVTGTANQNYEATSLNIRLMLRYLYYMTDDRGLLIHQFYGGVEISRDDFTDMVY